jgi:23S rRNA (uracil1939-C5)-methyltransferase
MLTPGATVELVIEKPAAGGWMIARHLGQVVLVRGAIPGERVSASIERAEKRVAYAVTRDVLEASPDRRASHDDPLCGGSLYSHIAYDRQLTLKADVIRDAFARLGRHTIETPFNVAASAEEGYRMRARLHVHAARAGFYREGTHQLCDAAATRQLRVQTVATVQAIARGLDRDAPDAARSVAITENLDGSQRAAHVELAAGARGPAGALDRLIAEAGIRGVSARAGDSAKVAVAGLPVVSDWLASLTSGRVLLGELQRHAEAFFQGNRYLLSALVSAVIDSVIEDEPVLDLYAGVGLFSVALAAARNIPVTAVEGDRTSGGDLVHNSRPHEPGLRVVVGNVEDYLDRRGLVMRTMIVDPPRTGMSKRAIDGVIRQRPARVVYVSCDPPTLARDARRLLDGGYSLESIRAFDFFPNTPHVETLAVFDVQR